MMELKQAATAGTLESNDILITAEPSTEHEVSIQLSSSVEKQFGKQIRQVILQTAQELGISCARVTAVDKGALDCTVRARALAALCRSAGLTEYPWGGTE